MFTGIIEEMGRVREIVPGHITIEAQKVLEDMKIGSSISVNGVCLTVTDFANATFTQLEASKGRYSHMASLRGFTMDIMTETLERTNLGDLRAGDMVNLERAVRLDDRLGGHLVTGHIDEVGRIETIRHAPLIKTSTGHAPLITISTGQAKIFEISCSPGLARYIIPKGSIAVDGISLTIITDAKNTKTFKVSIIPHTLQVTTLGIKGVGDKVNLEADLIGKYVARLLDKPIKREDISLNFLKEHGFA